MYEIQELYLLATYRHRSLLGFVHPEKTVLLQLSDVTGYGCLVKVFGLLVRQTLK